MSDSDKPTMAAGWRPVFYSLLLAWCVVWFSWPGRIDNLDAKARYSVAVALVEDGSLALKKFHVEKIPYWYFEGVDGRTYCGYSILHSLLMVPGVWLMGGERGAAMVSPVLFPTLFLLIFSLLLRAGYTRYQALATTLVTSLCTMLLPYAISSQDVLIQTVLVLGSLRCLLARDQLSLGWAALAGLLWGAMVNTQPTAIMAVPALVWLLHRAPAGEGAGRGFFAGVRGWLASVLCRPTAARLVAFVIGTSPMIALLLWYNHLRFGTLLGLITVPPAVVSMEGGQVTMQLMGNVLVGMLGFIFSPSKSVFVSSLPLLLALYCLPRFVRRAPALGIAAVALGLCYWIGFGMVAYWHGDWSWGPRYLLPVIVLLTLPFAEVFARTVHAGVRKLALALIVLSLLVQGAAVSVDPYRFFHERDLAGGFHLIPESTYLYFSFGFMPLADTVAALPELASNTADGLLNDRRELLARYKALHATYLRTSSPRQRDHLGRKLNQMTEPEHAYLDYWWVRDLMLNKDSVWPVVLPPLLLLAIGLCLLRLIRLHRSLASGGRQ